MTKALGFPDVSLILSILRRRPRACPWMNAKKKSTGKGLLLRRMFATFWDG